MPKMDEVVLKEVPFCSSNNVNTNCSNETGPFDHLSKDGEEAVTSISDYNNDYDTELGELIFEPVASCSYDNIDSNCVNTTDSFHNFNKDDEEVITSISDDTRDSTDIFIETDLVVIKPEKSNCLVGRRIIEIKYFLDELKSSKHKGNYQQLFLRETLAADINNSLIETVYFAILQRK
ncbi:hypothetical protein FQA39_LY13370 [Lamprigera yunnana]|nr:hypothetical protein FQA39_LY13370 [Lamprigera yunnana]